MIVAETDSFGIVKEQVMLIRLFIVVFLTLASASLAMAEDGYTAVGAGYYTDSAGDYYTREKAYWGYYYDYYGRYVPKYWYFKYTPASRPVSSLTPRSTDADWIDFLAQREKITGSIRANQEREDAFLARLKAVGVTPPFPAVPGYNGGSYGSSYNKLGVLQGNTIYSYSQVADLYNSTDINVLFQQSAALVKGAQGLASDGNSQFSALVQQANTGAARVAEIRAQGEIDVKKLKALQPPSRIVTTLNGQVVAPVDATPGPMVKVMDDAGATHIVKAQYVKDACLSCHGAGGKPEGGLDLSRPITAAQWLSVINRVSTKDEAKRMPRTKTGVAGPQADLVQIRSLTD